MSRVLYPGSFDPLHLGHLDVIEHARELFGEVVVAVLHNHAKDSGMFHVDERVEMARTAVSHLSGVSVSEHAGLAVQAAEATGSDFVVKGLRTPGDFEIEQQMAHMNHSAAGVRTVFLPCRPDLAFVSSRFVREIAKYGGDVAHLVPRVVADALAERFDGSEQNRAPR
ncbi:pantetheine-phosphate adenylyltransferase [Ilumatobacter sp.]|uniref:pantetheine-phosphate adenylyltransferase n=1 Tax=Ilumatobacter sp. TaxID=1967498 RepID=UPI003B52D429